MEELARALMASPFGAWARGEAYVWANVLHLLGLVMLVGGIGILDLRIAGLFRSLPLQAASRVLTPFAVVGLLIMVPTGFIMFAADAEPLSRSATFRWKLALIAIALANAAAFRVLWRRHIDGVEPAVPPAARIMAAASVGLWLWIGALGRLIAYS